jgi:hypothetical protein
MIRTIAAPMAMLADRRLGRPSVLVGVLLAFRLLLMASPLSNLLLDPS